MKTYDPNKLLADLIMKLNELDGNFFNKAVRLYKIYEFNKNIRQLITRTSYDAIKIYEILIFLNTALKIGLLKDMDKDYYNFTILDSSRNNIVVSGKLHVEIPYNDRRLQVTYKTVVEGNDGNIEMKWVVLNDKEARHYSMNVKELSNRLTPDDRMSESKQLQFQSAKILSNALQNYIEIIVRNLYNRYIH